MIQRVKGTQDFLDLRLLHFIVHAARAHFKRANFTEILTPIIEPTELFARAVGEHTDIVHKEMYLIKSHNPEDTDNICLRPEATAATARAFIENGIQTVPWKVFTWGPYFRYERPQKGRFRQFYQFNAEIIGSPSMATDALFIKQLDSLFADVFRLREYALAINFLGTTEDRVNYKTVLKKFLDKNTASLCPTCTVRKESNILRIFDCKNESCQTLYLSAPVLTDYLSENSQAEWQDLQKMLRILNVSFVVKPTLVRGLDYYNKTVFEFISTHLGAQSSFGGGGRYDGLVSMLGGKEDQPSMGAAFGIERIMMLLEPLRDQLPLEQASELTVVIPYASEQIDTVLLVTDALLRGGIAAEAFTDIASFKSQLRRANRLMATHAVIIGPDEQAAGVASVKQMITGTEKKIPLAQLVTAIKQHEIK